MDVKKFIGEKIKTKRESLNMTQEQLSDAMGLTRTSIMNIESGRHSPTIEGLVKLCSILGIDTSGILPKQAKFKKELVTVEKRVIVKKKVKVWKIVN